MQLIPAYFARTRPLALAACLFLLITPLASAAVSNDECEGAVPIPGTGPFPFLTEPGIIDGASVVGDPPFPPSQTFDTNITHSVWYRFTPAESGLYTISTALDTDTNLRDTTMVMYTAGAECANFTIYAYNEDSGTLRSAISTNLIAGTDYYIVVWAGRTQVITEVMELQLRVTKPVAPLNDSCANPIVIPSLGPFPYLTTNVVDTTLATTTSTNVAPVPPCVTNIGTMPSRDVWYQFTPSTSGTYTFSTGADTATRIEDTSIELYTGNCNSLNQVRCNDNSFGRAVLSEMLSAGVTYYLAVYDNAARYVPGETDLQLRVAPATAPTVVTLPASSITSTGVALNGTINANGLLSRFWFEWGSTPSLGSTSAVKVLFATASTFVTNIFVSGFQPETTYHYRIVGTNSLGRGEGGVLTFVFSNAPPPQITTYGYEESRAFLMEFNGTASHLYVIQGSTNLINWLDLGLATEGSPAYFNFRHSSPEPQRFYRIRQP